MIDMNTMTGDCEGDQFSVIRDDHTKPKGELKKECDAAAAKVASVIFYILKAVFPCKN